MKPSTSRRLAAEAIGTCLLVATVVGSGIMAERLSDGNLAVALLGNTLATGAVLCVLIQVLGPLSGAHFNPAVTLVFFTRGEIGLALSLGYVAVQFSSAGLGTMLAHLMFDLPLVEHAQHIRTGAGQVIAEAVATFALVIAILGTLATAPKWVAPIVALTITAGYWFASSTSFANPAVTFARTMTNSFSGIRLVDAPGFFAGQLAGALAAAIVARWLWAPASAPTLLPEAGAKHRA